MKQHLLCALALLGLLLAVGRAWAEGPPEPIWQEGPDGPVYGPSPLHLYPAALIEEKGVVRLPDRVVFAAGSATLDLDGMQIVLLQGERLRQLPDHSVTLFCGWSTTEARALGETLARQLAADRCRAVTDVYNHMNGMPPRSYGERLVGPTNRTSSEELQRSVAITVVGEEGAREIIEWLGDPIEDFFGRDDVHGLPNINLWISRHEIYVPELIHFSFGSDELSFNARAILVTIADALTPGPARYHVRPQCGQYAVESAVPGALALRRCERVIEFLLDRGLCDKRTRMFQPPIVFDGSPGPDDHPVGMELDLALSIYIAALQSDDFPEPPICAE